VEQHVDNLYTILAALAGPLCVGVVVLIALWMFHEPLAGLMKRVNALNVAGMQGAFGEQESASPRRSPLHIADVASVIASTQPKHA